MRNAAAAGISLQEIAIIYVELTPDERGTLKGYQQVTHESDSTVIAKFPSSGTPLFADKATGVLYLAAS